MNPTIWSVLDRVGGLTSTFLFGLLAVYAFPNSPLRRVVDEWIKSRVSHYFDKELESHRHVLALDAERVRAEHQRLLHNAALVAERKHEIYRRLFHLVHAAMGRVVHLYGSAQEPAYDAYSPADLHHYMTTSRFPGKVKAAILEAWGTDRAWALKQLRTTVRHGQIEDAERAFAKAWNYFIGNSLYLPDPISAKAREAFEPLRKTLALAKTPGGTGDYIALRQEASDRVEELRLLLRDELRVVDDSDGKMDKGQEA